VGAASTSGLATSSAAPAAKSDRSATSFRVASFNTLGASHTAGRQPRASGVARTPWAVRLLRGADISVAGLQEFQPPQIKRFNRVATEYRAWPGLGSRSGVNSLVWRKDTWRPVAKHTVPIPYFRGVMVPMPYVLLRNTDTGDRVWFANFHNPADARGPAQHLRNAAVRREVALVNRLRSHGTPVVVTGDFNDRAAFFCPISRGTGVASADGSHLTNGRCRLPRETGVDWIVGTRKVDFDRFHRVRTGLVRRTSDHPFVWSRATVR
jgi:hypothetical protein